MLSVMVQDKWTLWLGIISLSMFYDITVSNEAITDGQTKEWTTTFVVETSSSDPMSTEAITDGQTEELTTTGVVQTSSSDPMSTEAITDGQTEEWTTTGVVQPSSSDPMITVTQAERPVSQTDRPVSNSDRLVSNTDWPVSNTDRPDSNTDRPVSNNDRPESNTDRPVSRTERPVSLPEHHVTQTDPLVSQTAADNGHDDGRTHKSNTDTTIAVSVSLSLLLVLTVVVVGYICYRRGLVAVAKGNKQGKDQVTGHDEYLTSHLPETSGQDKIDDTAFTDQSKVYETPTSVFEEPVGIYTGLQPQYENTTGFAHLGLAESTPASLDVSVTDVPTGEYEHVGVVPSASYINIR